MAYYKATVTLLLTHLSYCSLALSRRYIPLSRNKFGCAVCHILYIIANIWKIKFATVVKFPLYYTLKSIFDGTIHETSWWPTPCFELTRVTSQRVKGIINNLLQVIRPFRKAISRSKAWLIVAKWGKSGYDVLSHFVFVVHVAGIGRLV